MLFPAVGVLSLDTRSEGRAFCRLVAGLRLAVGQGYLDHSNGGGLYFLTLTSSNESPVSELSTKFNALVKRVRRDKKEFEYFRLRTFEGENQGVLHIVFKGSRLDVDWIRKSWIELYSARQMFVTECYGNLANLVRYLVKYLQHHAKFKFGFSKGWLWPSWKRDFKSIFNSETIARKTYKKCVSLWNNLIDRRCLGFYKSVLPQSSLLYWSVLDGNEGLFTSPKFPSRISRIVDRVLGLH